MYKFSATFMLAISLFLGASVYAEEDTHSIISLEMVEVTIRMTGDHPYGELQPCPECPIRLLPFAPNALVYINGKILTSDRLQDGQTLEGTVFLRDKPINSINEIIAK